MCLRKYTWFDLVWRRDVPLGCIDIHKLGSAIYGDVLHRIFRRALEILQIILKLLGALPKAPSRWLPHLDCFSHRNQWLESKCRFSELNASWDGFRKKLSAKMKVNPRTRVKVKFEQTTVSSVQAALKNVFGHKHLNWETYFQNICNFQSLFCDPHSNLPEFHHRTTFVYVNHHSSKYICLCS